MARISHSLKRLTAALAIVVLGMFAGSAFAPASVVSMCMNQSCDADCTWDPDAGTSCEWSCQPTALMNCIDLGGDCDPGPNCIIE